MEGLIPTFFGFLKILDENDVKYMVVGSMAAMIYGEPRMTHDMDIVIHVSPRDAQKLEALFNPEEFYCPPIEVIRSEIVHRGQFNLIHHESGLKIDLVIRRDTEHATVEFNRRRRVPFWQGNEAYVASPEDIIVAKLDYYRQGGSQKHLTDIRGILAETEIDEAYLTHWVTKLGLQAQWLQVSAS